jgi:TatD DNase family protein
MRWFDTHCHLDRLPAGNDLAATLSCARKTGVEKIIVPGVAGSPQKAAELILCGDVELAWGVHPDFIDTINTENFSDTPWQAAGFRPVAIGECGFDRRSRTSVEEQQHIFVWQLELAAKYELPAIIHLVGHYQRAFDLLEAMAKRPRFVMHSWSGSAEMAKRFAGLGAYVSVSGGHLRRPEKLARLLAALPTSSLLLETDAPDMIPPFWSGDFNEPSALPLIGAAVAEIAGMPVEKLAEILYNNSVKLFGESRQNQYG